MVDAFREIVTAALLIIGDEILSGRTQDKNLSVIAKAVNERGVQLKHVRVIADDEATIIASVNELRVGYDYVFTTGGIGPTHDDITSPSVARAFGVEWRVHAEAHALLSAYYERIGVPFNEHRLRMAKIPVGAVLLPNSISIAPGFCIGNVFVMAGVPMIMEAMLVSALEMLDGGVVLHSQTIACDLGEGTIAESLGDLQRQYADVTIGSYPIFRSDVQFGLHVVVRGSEKARLNELCEKLFVRMTELGGNPTMVKCE